MMIDENPARLRAHRINVLRYRKLLATRLSDLERDYIERWLQEERASMDALSQETFPFSLPAVQRAATDLGGEDRHVQSGDAFVIRGDRGENAALDHYLKARLRGAQRAA
jgi:hypothetical protein